MHPIVKLLPGRHKRLKSGHPWIFSNEVAKGDGAPIDPGATVTIVGDNGETYGTALYNPHSLVAGRLIDRSADVELDTAFFSDRIARAVALRDRLFAEPYYRLIHAEADGLPGLIVDRYGDTVVIQCNVAGMDVRRDAILDALDRAVSPNRVILRNDSRGRVQEGLPLEVATLRGNDEEPVVLQENGATFAVHPAQGQKTGWFFDQRQNRAFVAALARGGRLIDFYSYGGGFSIQALKSGATEAVMVDRSASAMAVAADAASLNGVVEGCRFVKQDSFDEMERLSREGERFDVVVADPPAFVKSKKDARRGSRAYRKMTRLAARLVAPGGILFVASCSHNVAPDLFADLVKQGLGDAGRSGRILRSAGAGPDHPVHHALPETAYLKSLTLQLD
jgi:23S rRNA (cytosine1962-C5)-methyltransferase